MPVDTMREKNMAAGPLSLDSHLLQISEFDVERRKKFVDLQQDDLARIAAVRAPVVQHLDEHAGAFFDYLSRLREAAELFSKRDLLDEAKRLKHEHLIAMVGDDYGKGYIEQRLKLGVLYSQVGLDSRVFLGAFHALLRSIGGRIMTHFARDPTTGFEHFMSLQKIAFFDIGIIVDVLIAERERTIKLQQEAIRELSTPTLQIRDRLLILPIIGVLDSFRAKQLTDGLLRTIRANRAKVVVMDITGVATVDSRVANHLIQTVAASRLMGAKVIITGLSAEVAQALVTLGVDLGRLNAIGDLQGGLEEAERMLGLKVIRQNGSSPQYPLD
jgi:rsbT co-antagonist protein RsbR